MSSATVGPTSAGGGTSATATATATSKVVKADIVVLDYNDLVNGVDVSSSIGKAYGVDGCGVLTVKNVPGLEEARNKLLPLAKEFSALDQETKLKYENKESFYSFGWSHGKEKLQGKPDVSKGSYYANPQYDEPETDPELIKKYPAFIHPNIWPKQELPQLEGAFKGLGQLIVDVGILVAQQCDKYIKTSVHAEYEENKLSQIIASSKCCKARLLHYFPRSAEEVAASSGGSEGDDLFSSWCGWHNDHGSLTGLVSAMFLNEQGERVENKDPDAGLYIRSRQSELIKVGIPADHIAFQIGETAQIHSGGALQATPHAVRGTSMPGISRETFAVFMEPMWFEAMNAPKGVSPEQAQSQSAAANLPKGVAPLSRRYTRADMTFGDFTDATLNSYYDEE